MTLRNNQKMPLHESRITQNYHENIIFKKNPLIFFSAEDASHKIYNKISPIAARNLLISAESTERVGYVRFDRIT